MTGEEVQQRVGGRPTGFEQVYRLRPKVLIVVFEVPGNSEFEFYLYGSEDGVFPEVTGFNVLTGLSSLPLQLRWRTILPFLDTGKNVRCFFTPSCVSRETVGGGVCVKWGWGSGMLRKGGRTP